MSFALLTHTQKDAGSGTITTTAIDTTGATLIVIGCSTSSDAISISDSQTNRWFGSQPVTAAATQDFTFFFCLNPTTSASHTFSMTAGNFPCMCVASFSGTIGVLGTTTTASNNTSTLTLPSITPASNNALLVTGICGPNADTQSINGGFTITDQGGGTSGQRGAFAYLIQTSAAAASPTWTNSATRQLAAQMMYFQLGGGGGGSAGGSYPFVG